MRPFLYPALSIALVATPVTLHAQALTTGAIDGVVRDSQGNGVPNAEVSLSSAIHPDRVRADEDGTFHFDHLEPGSYTLTCTAPGFATVRVETFPVALGQTARLALTLRPASVTQTITTRASEEERPSLDDSPLNGDLLPRELAALPLDGRRFQQFALLTPLTNLADDGGLTAENAATLALTQADDAASGDTAQTTTRAIDPSQGSFTQDGAAAYRAYDGAPRGGADVPFNIPLEAVQEFQVRALGTATLQGRDIAGSVNAVTRRAEDALHGSAFFLLRNSAADAADPFAVATRYNGGSPVSAYVKPRDQREQFGGSVGRLLTHTAGRVYAFGAAEAQRRSFPGISSPDNPAFYTLTPTQRALLGNRGVTAASIARGLTFLDELGGEVPRNSSTLALTPRLDVTTGKAGALTATYTGVRHDAPSGLRDGAVVPRSRDNFQTLHIAADTLHLQQNLGAGPRWLLTARAAVSRDLTAISAAPALDAEPHTGPGGTVPQVSIDLANAAAGGAFRFGSPVSAARRRLPEERRGEFAAQGQYSGGTHTLTLALTYSVFDTRVDTATATSGAYQYASGSINGRAGGLVDFLTDYTYSATSYPNGGCPSIFATTHLFCFQGFTQTFGAETGTRFHTAESSFSVHDVWRLTPQLHVTLGARYESFRMPPPQHTNAALDAVFANTGVTSRYASDPGNLAPRLAVAYGLGGRTVVRAGYGVHFGRVPGRLLQQVLTGTAQPASSYSIRVTPVTSIDPACSSAGTNFGYPATYTCSYGLTASKTSAATLLSRRFQLPMVQDGELSVERQLPGGFTVGLSYAAVLSRELPNSADVNIAPSTAFGAFAIQRADGVSQPGLGNGSTFAVPVYTSRISPDFGPVTAVLSNGNGVYQAGVVQVSRTATAGLTLHGAYTFSKSLDNLRVSGSAADSDAMFDPHEPAYDRALSNLDRRHKVVVTGVWSPVVERGSHWVRRLANGWTAAPIVFVTSGRPYSFLVEGGPSLPGGRASLNGSGGATYLPNVGRNTLRLPPLATVDLRVGRAFALRDRAALRFTAEGFNLFNHRNVTGVTQRAFLLGTAVNGVTPLIFQDAATISAEGLTSRPFGTAVSAGTDLTRARRVQVGVRLEW